MNVNLSLTLQSLLMAKADKGAALRAQVKALRAEQAELKNDVRDLCNRANATPAGKDACYLKYTKTTSR